MNPFNLVMISAFWEQAGNVTQRFLDSHPQLMVYPFESQISTPLSSNLLAGPQSAIPQRYAYPEFNTEWTAEQAYHAFWDQELKTYLRTPQISKFKDCGLVMDEKERIREFEAWSNCLSFSGREGVVGPGDRRSFVQAFFRSTFDTWTNYSRTGKETHYVGYSPPILLDADKFFADFPQGKMIHVIRNPFGGYADTKKRPFPMGLVKYCQIWSVCQLMAATYQEKYKGRFLVVRYEDLIADRLVTLNRIAAFIGIDLWPADKTPEPTFNRQPMPNGTVYPWGTIKYPTVEVNEATLRELAREERHAVYRETGHMLRHYYEFAHIRDWLAV